MSPLFSIITVTYNAEKVLERTLRSVAEQSYARIEYIVIDGASTDGTMEIVTSYKSQSPGLVRFEVISEPDKGLYDAMNKGLRVATGDYVWFLNAGDTLQSPETVARLAEVAERNGMPDILYGETDVVDEEAESAGAFDMEEFLYGYAGLSSGLCDEAGGGTGVRFAIPFLCRF